MNEKGTYSAGQSFTPSLPPIYLVVIWITLIFTIFGYIKIITIKIGFQYSYIRKYFFVISAKNYVLLIGLPNTVIPMYIKMFMSCFE